MRGLLWSGRSVRARRSQQAGAANIGETPRFTLGPMSGGGLYGREGELEAIAGALDAVARGERRLLTVRGEAGIGKTRLLTELRERAAAQRFVVLEGRATELERRRSARADRRRARAGAPGRRRARGARARATRPARRGAARARHARRGARRGHRALAPAPRPGRAASRSWPPSDRCCCSSTTFTGPTRRPASCSSTSCAARRPTRCSSPLGLRPGPAGRGPARRAALEPRTRPRGARPAAAGARRPPRRCWTASPAASERDRLYSAVRRQPAAAGRARPRRRHPRAARAGSPRRSRAEVAGLPDDARALVQAAAVAGDPFELDLATRIAALDTAASLGALDVIERQGLVRADPRPAALRLPPPGRADRGARHAGRRSAARRPRRGRARAGARRARRSAARAQHLAHAAAPGDVEAAAALRAAAAGVRLQAPGRRGGLAGGRAPRGSWRPQRSATLVGTLVEAGRLAPALEVVDHAAERDPGRRGWPWRAPASSGSWAATMRRGDGCMRALEATAPGSPEATRVLADLASAAYLRGEYAEMREWAQRIEPTFRR